MNLYILVEGSETELQLYPKWLSYLIPQLTKVERFDAVSQNSYYIFSGQGIPSIYNHMVNAIKDINDLVDKYDYLIVVIDAEEVSVEMRKEIIARKIREAGVVLNENCNLEVIVHNRCIETWFLGNRKIYKRNPQGERFKAYSKYYNVQENDPELMEKPSEFPNNAYFHEAYLREMLKEHNLRYRKSKPGEVLKQYYLDELIKRVEDTPAHLNSFSKCLELLLSIKNKINK